jgi:hypothetical protein
MKTDKLLLIMTAAILVLAAAPIARAVPLVPNGTYMFTSTDTDTALNGSWVTFSGDQIVNWNLVDVLATTNGVPTDIPLTPANSFILSSGVLGSNLWYFTIDGNHIATQPFDSFEGENNLFPPGPGGGTGALFDGFGDPYGNWSPVATPDSGSSFVLLGTAMIGIAGLQALVRRPVFLAK